jgi:hypothetical protein
MGSFTTTCFASSIRINWGDEIYAVLLMSNKNRNLNWSTIGLPISGKYYDYGTIELDNDLDGEKVVDLLRPYIKPECSGGDLTYNIPIFTDTLNWEGMVDAIISNRLKVLDRPIDSYSNNKENYFINKVNSELKSIGLKFSAQNFAADQSNVLYIETSFEPMEDIIKLENTLKDMGYAVMQVASVNATRDAVRKDNFRPRSLIIAPGPDNPSQNTYFGSSPKEASVVEIAYLRKDYFDKIVPAEKALKRAEDIAKILKDNEDLFYKEKDYYIDDLIRSLNLWGIGNGYGLTQNILAKIIKNLGPNATPESLVRLVRFDEFVLLLNGPLGRGIHPIPRYVGSQEASEDWPFQAKAFDISAKICKDLKRKK